MTLMTLDRAAAPRPATRPASRPASRRTTGPAVPALPLVWLSRWRSRRALAQLDDRMLTDIGLDPVDRRREIDKPFWQA
jgi:uncharacterized protein YjiS (DUF1127 family)